MTICTRTRSATPVAAALGSWPLSDEGRLAFDGTRVPAATSLTDVVIVVPTVTDVTSGLPAWSPPV